MDDLLELPSAKLCKRLLKEYDPDQPRDEQGRWERTLHDRGRFTTHGRNLGLTNLEAVMLGRLRENVTSPFRYKRSSEGQGWRVAGGPWHEVSLDRAGVMWDELGSLRRRGLVTGSTRAGNVRVRMVDQDDWWNP